MTDPVTVGALVASTLALAGETLVKSAVTESVKDAYKALKERVARWAGHDVEALEKAPTSAGRQSVVAEAIDRQSAEERAVLRDFAERLIGALRQHVPVGLDVKRLDAAAVQLSSITVTEGTGARFEDARVSGTFSAGPINVGQSPGKS
jgi:hypothetical protein